MKMLPSLFLALLFYSSYSFPFNHQDLKPTAARLDKHAISNANSLKSSWIKSLSQKLSTDRKSSNLQATRARAHISSHVASKLMSHFQKIRSDSHLHVVERDGLTFDKCSSNNDCAGSRVCVTFPVIQDDVFCSSDAEDCRCMAIPPVECESNDVCESGEICTEVDDETKYCASRDSDLVVVVSEEVCVDATALSSFHESDLVFDTHRWAIVSCDPLGSCATAGHMVVWNGKGMMMKTYCEEIGGCEQKKMLVNSPRWRRKVRVVSKTKGLEYTAFAARYETKMEEYTLKTAVHIGL